MKWTAWEIIRLLVVVAASMAAGMALLLGFGWLVLTLDKVVKAGKATLFGSSAIGVSSQESCGQVASSRTR